MCTDGCGCKGRLDTAYCKNAPSAGQVHCRLNADAQSAFIVRSVPGTMIPLVVASACEALVDCPFPSIRPGRSSVVCLCPCHFFVAFSVAFCLRTSCVLSLSIAFRAFSSARSATFYSFCKVLSSFSCAFLFFLSSLCTRLLCFSLDASSDLIYSCFAAYIYIYAFEVNIMDFLKFTIGSCFLLLILLEMVGSRLVKKDDFGHKLLSRRPFRPSVLGRLRLSTYTLRTSNYPRTGFYVSTSVKIRPHGHCPSAQTHSSVRADVAYSSLPPSRPRRRGPSMSTWTLRKFYLFIYFLLVVVACWKNEEKNLWFSVFNPRVPRAPRAKPREEEGFFSLVLLVTHPSSIHLLGGLTPKFLSLSFHSF
jgi:uncharacterized membrane protein